MKSENGIRIGRENLFNIPDHQAMDPWSIVDLILLFAKRVCLMIFTPSVKLNFSRKLGSIGTGPSSDAKTERESSTQASGKLGLSSFQIVGSAVYFQDRICLDRHLYTKSREARATMTHRVHLKLLERLPKAARAWAWRS